MISDLKTQVFREGQTRPWDHRNRIRLEKLCIYMLWEVSATPWASITSDFKFFIELWNGGRLELYGWVASVSCLGSGSCLVPVYAGSRSRRFTHIWFTPVPVFNPGSGFGSSSSSGLRASWKSVKCLVTDAQVVAETSQSTYIQICLGEIRIP